MVEQACQKLTQGQVDEMQAEVKAVLKKMQPPRPNINREEKKALIELGEDKTRLILTAKKEVVVVVMGTQEYTRKAVELLNQPAYKSIPVDPTTRQKNKLINIKAEGGTEEATYRRIYLTGVGSPKFYGLPKIHRTAVPLRLIVSSRGALSY